MTTNTRDRQIFERGIEVGRASAKSEMEAFAMFAHVDDIIPKPRLAEYAGMKINVSPETMAAKASRVIAPKKPKVVARGVKSEPKARTKGVKEAILGLIASEPAATTERIILLTGFKDNSVRGTLMAMQKKGLVRRDENKVWTKVSGLSTNGGADSDARA